MNNNLDFFFEIYAPIISYVLVFEKYPNNFTLEDFKNSTDELIMEVERGLKNRFKEEYKEYLFPLVSFIDEKIFMSNWNYKRNWNNISLQKKYFNTLEGGEIFFYKFDRIDNSKSKELKLLYIIFLYLGFKGKYHLEDEFKYNQFLNYCNEYFKKETNIDPKDNILFENSYSSELKMRKKIFLNNKRIFFIFFLVVFFFFYFFYLNHKLEKDLVNLIDKTLVKEIIITEELLNQKIITERLSYIFNKNNIEFDMKNLTASILVNSSSFDKFTINPKSNFAEKLEFFSKEFLEFIIKNESQIDKIFINSYTSSEYRSLNNTFDEKKANYELSQRRASKVKDYFILKAYKNGIDSHLLSKKLIAIGRGSDFLIYDSKGIENKIASRRIEIKILIKGQE